MKTLLIALGFVVVASAASACGGGGSTSQGSSQGAVVAAMPDADGDGIPDDWETKGIDYQWAPDGSKHHLDLRGASTTHKDIVVFVAWMESPGQHSHRPSNQAIEIVKKAFDMALVSNPDGRRGITLHVEFAPSPIPEQAMLGGGDGNTYDWTAFDALKAKYFPTAFGNAIFFCVFAHDIDEPEHSGITKTIPGRDFIVSLGGFREGIGNESQQAGTFMHELGHALGLQHGGKDPSLWKPNYISVMNYFFQMDGLTVNGEPGNYRYSEFRLGAQEATLNEKIGLATDPALSKYSTFFYCASDPDKTLSTAKFVKSISGSPVDWNCDGKFDASVSTDVNGDGAVTPLTGASDWDDILLKPASVAHGLAARDVAGMSPSQELTARQADRVPVPPVADVHATTRGDAVIVQWKRIPLARVLAYRVYRSSGGRDEPIGDVDNAPATSFVDPAPAKGAVKYFVSAVFAPHSRQPEATPPPSPPPPLPLGGGGPRVPFPSIRAITGRDEMRSIRESAPTQWSKFETFGIAAPKSLSDSPLPPRLFETERSDGAALVVK